MSESAATLPARGSPGAALGAAANGVILYGAMLLALFPVGYLILSSFNLAPLGAPFRFGLDGWIEVFSSRASLSAALTSFLLALRSFIAIGVAIAISWVLVRRDIPGRAFIEISLWFAFFLPTIPIALSWILLLHRDYGMINQVLAYVPFLPRRLFSIYSAPGIIWVHITASSIPFLTIILAPAFRQIDSVFEEAARVNGASTWQTVRRIVIPMLAPAALGGLLASYIRGLEGFEIEQLLGTPAGIFVFTTRIYDLVNDDPPKLA